MCPFKVVWLPRTAHLDLKTSAQTLGVGTGVGAGVLVPVAEVVEAGTVTVPLTALA